VTIEQLPFLTGMLSETQHGFLKAWLRHSGIVSGDASGMSADTNPLRAFLGLPSPAPDAPTQKKRRLSLGVDDALEKAIEMLAAEDWDAQLGGYSLKKHTGNASRRALQNTKQGHQADDEVVVHNSRVRSYDLLLELLTHHTAYVRSAHTGSAADLPGSQCWRTRVFNAI
jgi:hypothetical protein